MKSVNLPELELITGQMSCEVGYVYIIDNPKLMRAQNFPYENKMVVMLLCRAGEADMRVNLKDYHIVANGMYITLPNQIVESVSLSDDFEGACMCFTPRFLDNLVVAYKFDVANKVGQTPYAVLNGEAKDALELYLNMCRRLMSVAENPNKVEILYLLTKAFFLGFGYFLHQLDEPLTATRENEITSSFVSMVEENYKEYRDLEFYAAKMCLTPKYISMVVKKTTGMTASKWVDKYVTLYAKSQLASTNRSVKEISNELNFPSQSFFGKYFRRMTGVSPSEYRARKRLMVSHEKSCR